MAENISPSKKEIYTKLLDIAGNYTDIEDGDFLKTGLFGYITESMAMMMRDSTFHKTMIYNESSLNTAIIPRSIYNWAKMFNIEVQKATPAYADIDIIIPTESLDSVISNIRYSDNELSRFGITDNNISNCIILDKEDPIIAGDYYFSLEHSILIRKESNNNITGYSARYILSEYESTNYQTLSSVKLSVKNNFSIDGDSNIIINARAYQYKRTVFTRQITSNSFLNKVQRFNFEDQFCGAKVFYIENGKENELQLSYSNMKTGSNVVYYNLNNENELEITFKSGSSYFSPFENSTLKIYIYTTKGSEIPSSFKGDALMLFSKNEMKSLPLLINFNPTSILSGKNAPTLDNIKQTIIDEISTRNTITTKNDLDSFFNTITKLIKEINDGKITFIKKRDDIIKRTYNAYLLIRDMYNDADNSTTTTAGIISACVPTNTIDIEVDATGNTSLEKINQDTHFKLNANGNYVISNNTDNDYYFSPFSINIIDKPIKYVKYTYDLTDDTTSLIYDENQSVLSNFEAAGHYMTPKSIRLRRDFSVENNSPYILEAVFTTDLSFNNTKESLTSTISGSIKVSGSSLLTVSDITVSSTQLSENSYETTFTLVLGTSEIKIAGDTGIVSVGINGSSFSDKERLVIDFSALSIDNLSLNGQRYISSDSLSFFQQLDDIMESNILTKDNKIVGIKDIPVIHSSFINSDDSASVRFSGFTKQLFTYIEKLKEYNSKLETSTFFSLKFYNTYGISQLYNTLTTNLNLGMQITLVTVNDDEKENLQAEIRSYIRKIVDKMNDDKQISVSNIIALLTNSNTYGKYISYIEFMGLNDTFDQTITYNKEMESKEDEITPEWLNISVDNIKNIQFK